MISDLTYRLQRAASVTGPWDTIHTQTANTVRRVFVREVRRSIAPYCRSVVNAGMTEGTPFCEELAMGASLCQWRSYQIGRRNTFVATVPRRAPKVIALSPVGR